MSLVPPSPQSRATLSYDQILSLMEMQTLLTIDTESGETRGLMGVSVAFDGLIETGFYLPWNQDEATLTIQQRDRLRRILSNESITLVFHNAMYDLKVLERHGLIPKGRKNFYDTMLMIHWINENLMNYSLDAQSKSWGGKPKNRTAAMQYVIDTYGWDGVTLKMNERYSSNDAWITHELFRKVLPEFIEQEFNGELWEIEQEFIWVMANMIERGIRIDLEFCIREMLKGQTIMSDMRAELMINPGSPIGLEKLLIKELQLPVVKHTKSCLKCNPTDRRVRPEPVHTHLGKPSFDKEAMKEYDFLLEQVNDERAKKILRYRGWQKTVSSNYKAYIDYRDSNNVLHPGYKLHGTETGRCSCEKPNLQQIPKVTIKEWNGNLKKAFIARDGFGLWEFDYSQLEFRLTCAYAEQEELIEVFNDDSRDIFDEMAAGMGWLRQNVKTLVYLILFGGGANRAQRAFSLETIEEGKELVEQFHQRYPGIRQISRKAQNLAAARGYVNYWTGRRRHFPRGSKYYRAFNSIIQGGEAEIVKRAMIKLDKEVCNEEHCRMVLQVHDSVVFEIAVGKELEYFPKIKKAMEDVDYDFGVRFRVDYKKWGEAA